MKKFFTSIWGVWILLTIIYLLLMFTIKRSFVTTAVGLFVPFGVANTIFTFEKIMESFIPTGLSLLLVGLGGIFLGSFVIKKLQLNMFWGVVASLIFLFFITLSVDMLLYQKWCSWALFEGNDCVRIF